MPSTKAKTEVAEEKQPDYSKVIVFLQEHFAKPGLKVQVCSVIPGRFYRVNIKKHRGDINSAVMGWDIMDSHFVEVVSNGAGLDCIDRTLTVLKGVDNVDSISGHN